MRSNHNKQPTRTTQRRVVRTKVFKINEIKSQQRHHRQRKRRVVRTKVFKINEIKSQLR